MKAPLYELKPGHIRPLAALQDNYIWLIAFPSGEAWVVDPGDAEVVNAALAHEQLRLQGILVTHHHGDHTYGVEPLVHQHHCTVYGSHPLAVHHHPPFMNVKILPIPGHTLDHLAFYTPGHLFCGDTLFAGGCGRVFEGTYEQMFSSLQTLSALPDETMIYCGHEYTLKNLSFALWLEPQNVQIQTRLEKVKTQRAQDLPTLPTSLKIERETNPFLRCHLLAKTFSPRSALATFQHIRQLKDQWS